jgi:hypothetical protein
VTMSISTRDDSPDLEGSGATGAPAAGQTPVVQTPAAGTQYGAGGGTACDSCGAPVDLAQRYCVECGVHRVGVNDPAAAYVNRQPAQAPRANRAVIVSSRRSRAVTALMLALIPVAIAVGVLVGRSSNNSDPSLLKAIRASHAQVVTVPSGHATVVTVGAGSSVTKTASKSKSTAKSTSSSTTAAAGKSAVGSKSTAAQKAQSAKIVKKLQNTNGESYLDPLPSQVGGG